MEKNNLFSILTLVLVIGRASTV